MTKTNKVMLILAASGAAVVLFGLCGVGAWYGLNAFLHPFSDPAINERNFSSNTERIQFIRKVSKVDLPDTATQIHIDYDAWIDWRMTCSFELPPTSYSDFVKSLQPRATTDPNVFQSAPDANPGWTLTKNDADYQIKIECSGE